MQSWSLRVIAALALLLAGLAWIFLGPGQRGTAVVPEKAAALPDVAEDFPTRLEPVTAEGLRDLAREGEERDAAVAPADGLPSSWGGRVQGLELPHEYSGLRAALWSEGVVPTCTQLASADAHSSPLRIVSVDPDGSFLFENLPADGLFRVRAGGEAHISIALERPVTVGEGPLLLQLVRVKGLEVVLIGRDGLAPRTHPDLVLAGSSFGGSALMAPGALLAPWEEQLAAIPGAGCDATPPGLCARFLMCGPPELPSLGPIACDFRVPGYLPLSRMLWAEPVLSHIPTVTVELESTVAGWGSLELELTGLCGAAASALRPDTELGIVKMVYADGSQLQLPLRGNVGVRRFDGIPRGIVQATFRSRGAYVWPREGATELHIGERPERMRVDLSGSGALEVRWASGPGEESPLASQLVLQLPDRKGALPLRVADLPLLLPIVAPGPWQLSSFAQRGKVARTSRETVQRMARIQVTVQAGALAELVLSDE